MLAVAEQHLTVPASNNRRTLHVWSEIRDVRLQTALNNRGYSVCDKWLKESQRRRPLSEAIVPFSIAEGYTIRALGNTDEHSARCWVSFRAFHPDDPTDKFEDGWYHNIQRGPLYRRDLDLVAVAPNADLAAFCTIWFDDVTRTGLFEPVGTSPDHQRHGLGKAILT